MQYHSENSPETIPDYAIATSELREPYRIQVGDSKEFCIILSQLYTLFNYYG